ncbi:MAG: hypothetical protein GC180_11980 [Bacteroidetes bacterium]|nr:hypothetical protein [Bacteroidota bacterium]
MYQRYASFGVWFMFLLQAVFAVDADVLVRNQHISNDTFFFDIYLQAQGSTNIFLGNSDFALDYNESIFTNQGFYYQAGSTILENSSGAATAFYDTNISTKLESTGINANKLMIIVQMPVYSNSSNFQARIARIDSRPLTHKLGTFFITGITTANTNPSLSWIISGKGLVTLVTGRDSAAMTAYDVNSNSVNPAVGAQPTVQASALQVSSATSSSLTLSWTRGNGDSCILLMRQGVAVSAFPENGLFYTADTVFGNGSAIGATSNYVVYNGSGNQVTISGLSNSTSYQFALMEYSGGNGWNENYLSTNPDTVTGTTGGAYITVNVTVFLAGPYKTAFGTMDTSLNANGYLPLSQPYSGNMTGWKYNGQESVSSIPNANIVDWVIVELRTGTSAADTLSSNSKRAGFLLKDGSIVDTNGIDPLRFYNVSAGYYYVVIRHRNHLAIMSSSPISISQNTSNYNFSSGTSTAYGNNSLTSKNGVYCMISCDFDGNGGINALDYNYWKSQNGNTNYNSADADMNGGINANDYNAWKANNGGSTNVPN